MRVGFAGAGNMAAAMARGWARAEGGPEAMLFCDLDADRADAVAQEVGGETRAALRELADELGGKVPALISVLAATPTAKLAEAFPGVPVLRVMPNQPVQVRRGILCYPPPVAMPEELLSSLLELLGQLGTLVPLEERLIDAATAIMSCSPAYIALVAEALARGGEREGLDGELAGELVAGALAGTAELLSERDPATIRDSVAPPGGATEAGLAHLEGVVEDAFVKAVDASLERMR